MRGARGPPVAGPGFDHLERIGARKAWETTRGQSSRVAHLDTGIRRQTLDEDFIASERILAGSERLSAVVERLGLRR